MGQVCGRAQKVQEVKNQESGEMQDQVVFLRAASESREKTQTNKYFQLFFSPGLSVFHRVLITASSQLSSYIFMSKKCHGTSWMKRTTALIMISACSEHHWSFNKDRCVCVHTFNYLKAIKWNGNH